MENGDDRDPTSACDRTVHFSISAPLTIANKTSVKNEKFILSQPVHNSIMILQNELSLSNPVRLNIQNSAFNIDLTDEEIKDNECYDKKSIQLEIDQNLTLNLVPKIKQIDLNIAPNLEFEEFYDKRLNKLSLSDLVKTNVSRKNDFVFQKNNGLIVNDDENRNKKIDLRIMETNSFEVENLKSNPVFELSDLTYKNITNEKYIHFDKSAFNIINIEPKDMFFNFKNDKNNYEIFSKDIINIKNQIKKLNLSNINSFDIEQDNKHLFEINNNSVIDLIPNDNKEIKNKTNYEIFSEDIINNKNQIKQLNLSGINSFDIEQNQKQLFEINNDNDIIDLIPNDNKEIKNKTNYEIFSEDIINNKNQNKQLNLSNINSFDIEQNRNLLFEINSNDIIDLIPNDNKDIDNKINYEIFSEDIINIKNQIKQLNFSNINSFDIEQNQKHLFEINNNNDIIDLIPNDNKKIKNETNYKIFSEDIINIKNQIKQLNLSNINSFDITNIIKKHSLSIFKSNEFEKIMKSSFSVGKTSSKNYSPILALSKIQNFGYSKFNKFNFETNSFCISIPISYLNRNKTNFTIQKPLEINILQKNNIVALSFSPFFEFSFKNNNIQNDNTNYTNLIMMKIDKIRELEQENISKDIKFETLQEKYEQLKINFQTKIIDNINEITKIQKENMYLELQNQDLLIKLKSYEEKITDKIKIKREMSKNNIFSIEPKKINTCLQISNPNVLLFNKRTFLSSTGKVNLISLVPKPYMKPLTLISDPNIHEFIFPKSQMKFSFNSFNINLKTKETILYLEENPTIVNISPCLNNTFKDNIIVSKQHIQEDTHPKQEKIHNLQIQESEYLELNITCQNIPTLKLGSILFNSTDNKEKNKTKLQISKSDFSINIMNDLYNKIQSIIKGKDMMIKVLKMRLKEMNDEIVSQNLRQKDLINELAHVRSNYRAILSKNTYK